MSSCDDNKTEAQGASSPAKCACGKVCDNERHLLGHVALSLDPRRHYPAEENEDAHLRALVQVHREERDAEFAARRCAEAEVARLREANERLTGELQALVDVFLNAPFLRAERLLHDLAREALDG